MSKPSLPQGTRDFGPETVRKRNYIFNTIRTVFELYCFQPLETPALENLETLMGKYGEEGDKLIFKVLNNGLDYPAKHERARQDFEKILEGRNVTGITERALKYDLTIPFARYVAMNHGQLTFPFKRYQVQPVWRADRPQKGRYREFYQCDADVVGSHSLINETELANIYNEVFTRLKLQDFRLHINNRKILKGIMQTCGVEHEERRILTIIDKTDKIGMEGVRKELAGILKDEQLHQLLSIYTFTGDNRQKLDYLKTFLSTSQAGTEGVADIETVLGMLDSAASQAHQRITLDLTLARGLEYYTGIIFEVKAPESVKIGSIGGGGRYDDLTGLFGVPDVPGVGISFGVDRIYDVLEELKLFPSDVHQGSQVIFFNLGDEESKTAYRLMQQLRAAGTSAEMYHEQAKFDKQFKYATKKNIPYAVITGSKEIAESKVVVKNLITGEQQSLGFEDLIRFPF
jgi:histidyl-tRNA synthetase